MEKLCTKCGKPGKFRIRTDKRCNPVSIYEQIVCMACEATEQRERSRIYRSTEEGRKKHNAHANKMYQKHRDKIKKKMKAYRDSKHGKAVRKAYIEKNKDKIFKQEQVTKLRYHEKNKNAITDKYATNLLKTQGATVIDKDAIAQKKKQVATHRIKELIRKLDK